MREEHLFPNPCKSHPSTPLTFYRQPTFSYNYSSQLNIIFRIFRSILPVCPSAFHSFIKNIKEQIISLCNGKSTGCVGVTAWIIFFKQSLEIKRVAGYNIQPSGLIFIMTCSIYLNGFGHDWLSLYSS